MARSGFRRQHHRIGTIQHGVSDVHHFRTGWHWVGDHGFHHLGRGDHRAVQLTCATNQRFLDTNQLRIADFHTQIAAGHHHHVRSQDHIVHGVLIANGFRAFNLGNDFGITACITGQTACIVQIFATAWEGDCQVVNADQSRSNDVRFVFIGQRFRREAAAQFVDTFIVGERAADGDFGEHFHSLNFEHLQLYASVVEQQDIARHHVSWQAFIVNPDFFFIAFAFAQVGIQQEFIADIEENFTFFEGGDTNFRTLQIAEDSDMAAQFSGDLTHFVGT